MTNKVVEKSKRGLGSGMGRPKGAPNKATSAARQAIAAFVDGNVERLNGLLDEIYEENGAKVTFECITELLEYHVPKLARYEHTGEDGGPIVTANTTDNEILERFLLKGKQ